MASSQTSPVLQRAAGRVAADVAAATGSTRLDRLHQAGCLKLRFPRRPDDGLEAILINTAGGLTGGDRLDAAFRIADGATLGVTTQACERIYRASAGTAEAATRCTLGENASLRFLPQETILFDGGRLRRRLEVDCRATSRLLLCESVILGRTLMGEVVRSGFLGDSWRVRCEGRLVFADELRFDGAVAERAAQKASLAGAAAFATIVCRDADPEGQLAKVRALADAQGGASLVNGVLVARLVAPTGFALRKRLVPILAALANRDLPRVWSL